MAISFKQFHLIMALPEDQLTEEKLAEIFGWSADEKAAKAKKALADLQAKKATALQKVQQAKADRATVARAGGLGAWTGQKGPTSSVKPAPRQSADRAGDLDWVRGMQAAKK